MERVGVLHKSPDAEATWLANNANHTAKCDTIVDSGGDAGIYFVPALYEKVYAAIKDGTGRSVEKACGEVISSTQSLAECKAKLGNAAYFALMPDLVIEFGNGVRVTIPSE